MKKFLVMFIWLFIPLALIAAPAKDYKYLSWNEVVVLVGNVPTTNHDQVQGYKLYCAPSILTPAEVDAFTAQVNVPNVAVAGRIKTELISLQINEGDNWCAATAWNYDNNGNEQEGDLSSWLNVKMLAGRFKNESVPAALSGFKLEQ